jgi:hypothetical protein
LKTLPDNAVPLEVTEHNHAPDPARVEALLIRHNILHRAQASLDAPRQIIGNEVAQVREEVAQALPTYNALSLGIRRKRKAYDLPGNPASVADLQLPQHLTRTLKDENFLLHDTGTEDDKRMLMFATNSNLELLRHSNVWFGDGTFKVVPAIFEQLYTIHALVNGEVMPAVYVLMNGKSEEDYNRLFEVLMRQGLQPQSFNCDFEKSVHNAVHNCWPEAEICGCLFHLGQCLWRKIQSSGLVTAYKDNENIRTRTKFLVALAFLPVDKVAEKFALIRDDAPVELDAIYDYWEDAYIGRMRRRGRRAQPLFPVSVWNVRDRLEHGLPRTNNSLEGWHRAFAVSVGASHPTIFRLVEILRIEQGSTETKLARQHAGDRQPPASKAKYVKLDRRLRELVTNYDEEHYEDFLRGVSYNVSL